MNKERLIKNIIDQIKEAQIKLGYVKETVRLYYPVTSLNAILGTDLSDENSMLAALCENKFKDDTVLGTLKFSSHKGRIEVSIPPEGVEYVHTQVPRPEFLSDMINLFANHHSCSLEDIKSVFGKYSEAYHCEKMQEGTDFDYALYFTEPDIDEYYYCVKQEMGHTIYHRFSKEDYELLLEV
ncbi:MAG: DUF3877 family protein [Lachnospiraceae bacterium]|jgi:hypothetical protein|nr:DUF3877 family protein [Lachnospiraceae bacterium]MDD3615226.1 DUF3877 family protein [Lachnospiraceae bacterium]